MQRTSDLHTSTLPHLHDCSRLPSSRASYLYAPRLHACSPSPYLRTSSSLHVQHASGALRQYLHICTPAPHLQTSFEATSPGPQHASRAPELLRQTPTRPYTRSMPPALHTSMSLRLHHTFRAPELLRQNTSTSPGPQHGTRGTWSLVTSHQFLTTQKLKGEGAYRTFRSSRHSCPILDCLSLGRPSFARAILHSEFFALSCFML